MKVLFTTLFLIAGSILNLQADRVSNYFDNCRKNGRADYAAGGKIIKDFTASQLMDVLNIYYTDSTAFIRGQAYYLTYRKGIEQKTDAGALVLRLAQGINDNDQALRGRIIGYLQEFPLPAFNDESKTLIASGISNPNSTHYDQLVLLAGFVGTGSNDLFRLSLNTDLPVRTKWSISLALARLGSENALQSCIEKVKRAPIDSETTAYLLPDLVYTRQKEALNYCVELIYIDEKLCQAANPDFSESILCAYPVIELIAPVIVDFPVKVTPGIGLDVDDYEAMLQTVRAWFNENPDYKIVTRDF